MYGDKETIDALRSLSGVDDLEIGFKEGIIKKVDLSLVNGKGWYVEFDDGVNDGWVYNYAMPIVMPEGEIRKNFLVPTEELTVVLDKRYPDGVWAIRGYRLESPVLGAGGLVFGRGDSFVSVSDGVVFISADKIKYKGTLEEVK